MSTDHTDQPKGAPIKMRVNVAGYAGEAVTLYGAYDPSNDVLLVAKEDKYADGPRPGFLLITNQERDQAREALFTEDDFSEAINAFFELDGLRLLTLSDSVKRHNPSARIERDGINESGVKYRISPDMTCGQVGVMVACLFANRQRGVRSAADFFNELITID